MNTQDDEDKIAQALAVCAELTGTVLTQAAFDVMLEDLSTYDVRMVLNALNRCRRELTGRLTLAAILQRMDCGLPSADEAFGLLAEAAKNEYLTVVVPEIAQIAMGQGAQSLLDLGDKTGARMAFRGAYERMVEEMRQRGEMGVWTVSAGLDKVQMETAIGEAVNQGKLSKPQAMMLLPNDATETRHKLQTGTTLSLEDKQKAQAQTAQILKLLIAKKTNWEDFATQQMNRRAAERAERHAALEKLRHAA
ncbi:hypothetical protein [Wielerella bovis]|uniref:hypothetical protein n=1 Tax=Wielerella bovis TaxID=2917790 RepID=UPI002019C9B0|nr:hypothetical protein [Wielerella bovis]ULJ60799.1 hypothetical protein MIS44_02755 [Wielerella bovis]ULJ65914.1 hypothetical protein MIS31_06430 [Wielerella bovis]ULJ66189.1 hypothetical protein MIS31_07885 [Wielerella bovis]